MPGKQIRKEHQIKRLDGKTCIVTGGGKGIGRATCMRLAREGARVAVTDIDDDEAKAVCEAMVSEGDTAEFWHLDVTDEAEVREVFDAIAERFGQIDVGSELAIDGGYTAK